MNTHIYKQLKNEAIAISQKAARLLKSLQNNAKVHKIKDVRDLSTNADILAEKLICKEITNLHPNHNILSEEVGFIDRQGEYTWVIDPLDGTQNYVGGLNDFAVLISIEYNNSLIAGVVNLVGESKILSGVRKNGSFLGKKKLNVSTVNSLEKSRVNLYALRKKYGNILVERNAFLYEKLIHSTYKTTVDDFDAKQLSLVALGFLDGHIRTTSGGGWWDVAPGIILVEEAGGKVTDFNGDPVTSINFTNGFIVSNGLIHNEILKIIQA